jgi:RHS repeat-associated protein
VAGQQNEYSFDDIGNRTTTKAGGDENGANLRSASYTSNSRNQYTSRSVPNTFDVLGIANSGATVTVNSAGAYRKGEYFRKELTVTNSSSAVWMGVSATAGGSPVSGNVFVPQTAESYTYDYDGNLTQDGHYDYTWDAENRLITIKTLPSIAGPVRRLEFEYDCQGRRIRKRVYDALSGGSLLLERKFLYDGWNVVAEVDGSNALVKSYLWGLDLSGSLQGAGGVGGLVAVKLSSGTAHFVAYDGNGNVAGLVDGSNGAVSALYEYGPFGETIRVTDTLSGTNPFRFSSKYTDAETDLVYYGYRYYNPNMGRWLSRDPIEEKGGLNLYGFVANDSVSKWDVLGRGFIGSIISHFLKGGGGDLTFTDQNAVNAIMQNGLEDFLNPMLSQLWREACRKARAGQASGSGVSGSDQVFVTGGAFGLLSSLLNQGQLQVSTKWEIKDCMLCLKNINVEYRDEIVWKDHFRFGPEWDRYFYPDDLGLIGTVSAGFGLPYDLGFFQEFMLYVRWKHSDVCMKCL